MATKKKTQIGNCEPEHTPLMKQWLGFKQQAGDLILFYRVGDFYELFWEDAERASKLLDITLTRRGESGGRPVSMAGVPWMSIDMHLAKLLRLGVGAAVADQVGDPAKSIGPVERAITRVLTPGTLVDEALLSERKDAPLLACHGSSGAAGLFWINMAAGEARFCQVPLARVGDEIEWIQPAETLTAEGFSISGPKGPSRQSPAWHFDAERGRSLLLQALGAPSLEPYGQPDGEQSLWLGAAAAALEHAKASLGGKMPKIARLLRIEDAERMRMDAPTRRSLEIDQSLRGEDGASLAKSLDECSTAMGSRKLRSWISSPLAQPAAIAMRHEAVESLMASGASALGEALRGYPDTERAGARAGSLSSRPRDFHNLRLAFERLPSILETLAEPAKSSPLVAALLQKAQTPPGLLEFLSSAIAPEPAVHLRDGGVIADGHSAELDELRALASGAEKSMQEMEQRERELTGIGSLRLDFNRAHGFSIEITRTHSDKVPSHYKRKMTLKNTERYTTEELSAFEAKVLSAKEKSLALEKELFEKAQIQLAAHSQGISEMSEALASLDALACFARISAERGYCKPELAEGSGIFKASKLRHPVAEMALGSQFIPNPADLNPQRRCLVVTGPNMGGKSTYMRSVALACVMAQAGCFAPAESLLITPMLQMFARVGASDDINKGQSTFMVEMSEAAGILRQAGPESLCIIDEIGRGTSTFDGMSLAWAILRHLHDVNASLCLFSTHYFELTDLANSLESCFNCHVGASLEGGQLRFLRSISDGAASQSHGIAVAKLAGVPELALSWARSMLGELEQGEETLARACQGAKAVDPPLADQKALAALREADADEMTPKQALETLYRLKAILGGQA